METFYITVDRKVATWNRHTIRVENCSSYDEAIKKVVSDINGNNLFYGDPDILEEDIEVLSHCEEEMTPEENGGQDTIEILKDHLVIWNNVDGYVKNT